MNPGEALVEGDTIQSMGSASSLPYRLVPCNNPLHFSARMHPDAWTLTSCARRAYVGSHDMHCPMAQCAGKALSMLRSLKSKRGRT